MVKIWTEVIASDIHIPHHDIKAVSCLLKSIKILKPDGITLLGDIADCDTFSRHTRNKPPKKNWNESDFYKESKHEYDEVNFFLDCIDKVSPKSRKTWAYGNHEIWIEEYIKENFTARNPLFNMSERFNLKARGYREFSHNKPIKLGKLTMFHGKYCGDAHAKKHVTRSSTSVLYGHVHDIQIYSLHTDLNETRMAWSNPCLCNLNPIYLKGIDQNWSHGFTIVNVWPDGNFQVSIVRITKGRCVVYGNPIY